MFKNLSIGKKLSLSFGLLLALLVVIGLVATQSLNTSAEGFSEYRDLARETNLIGRIQANMLEARLAAKNYVASGAPEAEATLSERLAAIEKFVATAQEEIEEPGRKATIKDIATGLNSYKDAFSQVVSLMAERDQLVKQKLNTTGPYMEKALTEILLSAEQDGDMRAAYNAGLGLRHLLLARLYIAKFLVSNESSAAERVATERSQYQDRLATLDRELQNDQRRELLKGLQAQEATYFKSFASVVNTIKSRNQLILGTMDLIGPKVAEDIEKLKLSIKQQQDNLGPRLQTSNKQANYITKGASLSALLIGIVIAVLLVRSLTRPILKSVEMAKEIAKGDFDIRIDLNRQDELGQLAMALNGMATHLSTNATVATEIAGGNLDVKVSLASDKDQLGLAFQKMIESLNEVMGQIQTAGHQINTASGQVADSSQTLSQGATETAASLEEISSSMNEMASQTSQSAENAGAANRLAAEASVAAVKGNKQMDSMVSAMSEINEAGQNISKIIKVIDEIAFQTNLLALNAAVEAARAGQHGKGFAVVAEEVRNLAARSAKAASETAELIEGSVEKTTNGTQIAEQTSAALDEIVGSITKVTDLMAEISAASNEQAQGISQVNQGLTQIDQGVQENTATAEESAAAAEEMSSQAAQLKQMISRFKLASNQVVGIEHSVPAMEKAKGIRWDEHETVESNAQINLDAYEFGRY